ncbi:MAG TPA: hypothetical protein VNH15_00805 [Elusimicrobiota bacterium]|nr:hypothetical protein [Elusimicrobiota bacterium]
MFGFELQVHWHVLWLWQGTVCCCVHWLTMDCEGADDALLDPKLQEGHPADAPHPAIPVVMPRQARPSKNAKVLPIKAAFLTFIKSLLPFRQPLVYGRSA